MKKRIKKLLSFAIALTLILSCMGTVYEANAATDGSITITNMQSNTHSFAAYQIFTGDVSGSTGSYTLSNIEWGSGIKDVSTTEVDGKTIYQYLATIQASNDSYPFKDGDSPLTTASDVAAALANYSADSSVLTQFASIVAKYVVDSTTYIVSGSTSTATDGTYNYTISGMEPGYYLVVDTTSIFSTGDAATANIVKVVRGNSAVETKEVAPSITKSIVEGTTALTSTSASAGDTITFQLTAKLPTDLTAYETANFYNFTMYDTLSANLTYVSGSISVTGTNGPSPVTFTSGIGIGTYTLSTGSSPDTLTISINNAYNYAGYTITVTYEATLGTGASSADAETNTVYLKYSNNPSDSSTNGETPEKKVYVHTFDLNVYKTDGSDPLSGASFTLYKSLGTLSSTEFDSYNGTDLHTCSSGDTAMTLATTWTDGATYYIQVGSETEAAANSTNYIATFNDLGEGNYVLAETVTPTGYNTAELVFFDISATYNTTNGSTVTKLESTTNSNVTAEDRTAATTTLKTTIANAAGSTMPETGGIGTTLFYIIGGILVLAAAILLITRRLMRREN